MLSSRLKSGQYHQKNDDFSAMRTASSAIITDDEKRCAFVSPLFIAGYDESYVL